jgi:hypothetical protein
MSQWYAAWTAIAAGGLLACAPLPPPPTLTEKGGAVAVEEPTEQQGLPSRPHTTCPSA